LEGGEEEPEQVERARPFPTLRERRYSNALERGLAILACFTPERPLLGIAEIERMLGSSHATTHRYVSTLVEHGYLAQDPSRKYRLDFGAIDVGMEALNAIDLCNHAHSELQALSRASGCTVEMAVLDGPEILLIDSVRARRGGRVKPGEGGDHGEEIAAGSRLPAYCTSLGTVLLAHLAPDIQRRLIAEMTPVEHGPKTILSKQQLREELERVRADGMGFNDEASAEGIRAIAAPVRDEAGDVIAAVNVVGDQMVLDLEDLLDRFEGILIATAARISKRLGWDGEQ
jgi:IclR family transcriptional regulator, pca regulon regulatory protein